MRVAFGVFAVLTATLALGACGGTTTVVTITSGPTQPDTASSSSTPSGSSSATTATAGPSGNTGSSGESSSSGSTSHSGSSGSGTSGSSGGGAGAPPCRASGLSLSYLGQQGATGHGELGFALKNVGSSSCHTIGYPGIQFLDRNGKPLPTTPEHTTMDFFGSAPVASLTVPPGGTTSFRIGVTHGAAGIAGCATAYGLQVIPPNDTATLTVQIPGGAFQCRTATVSPMRPGTSAYNSAG